MVGDSTVTGDEIRKALNARNGVADSPLPDVGTAVIVLHRDGETRIQGTIVGSTSVAWTRIDEDVVASDSAAAIAELIGAELDDAKLALTVAENTPFHIFASDSYWSGIFTVPAMHWLHLKPKHPPRTPRWWYPPAWTKTMTHSSELLRNAMFQAVNDAPASQAISADLSGGLDSTSVVYALAHLGKTPAIFHASSTSRWNDDAVWAHHAAAELGLDCEFLGNLSDHDGAFDGQAPSPRQLDHPPVWQASAGYLDALSSRLGEIHSTVHLTGLGGDELFGHIPGLLWSLASIAGKDHPAVKRFRQLHRWPRLATARALRSTANPTDELTLTLRRLRTPVGDGPEESLRWNPRMTLPQWASTHAESLVRGAIEKKISAGITPLDEDRGRHQILASLQFQGRILRQINQVYGRKGTLWRAPFLNTHVIEAALTLRVEERFGATSAKPLLAATTAPFMPHQYFARNGKGEYSYDIYTQFARKRHELGAHFDESLLASRGLINLEELAARIESPAAVGDVVGGVERLVSIEKWLNSIRLGSRESTVDIILATHS